MWPYFQILALASWIILPNFYSPALSAVPSPCQLERVVAAVSFNPLTKTAVDLIQARGDMNYKDTVRSRTYILNQDVRTAFLSDEA